MSTVLPVFPRGDLDQPAQMTATLGSFWSERFNDRAVVDGLFQGRAMLFEQATQDANEMRDVVSRFTVPVYHTELWKPLYLQQGVTSDMAAVPLQYGPRRALYGEEALNPPYNQIFQYGDSLIDDNNYAFPLPTDVKHIKLICNRLTNPSLVLVEGVDFGVDVEQGIIFFTIDVFNDERIAVRSIINSDGEQDYEALLWAFSCSVDYEYIWNHFGYVLGTKADSSEPYRDYVNAIWDMHTRTSFQNGLQRTIAAVMDVPVARGTETVEAILEGRKLQIVTDQNVYTYHLNSTPIVAVGDTVNRDDRLVDTFDVIDPKNVPDGITEYFVDGDGNLQPSAYPDINSKPYITRTEDGPTKGVDPNYRPSVTTEYQLRNTIKPLYLDGRPWSDYFADGTFDYDNPRNYLFSISNPLDLSYACYGNTGAKGLIGVGSYTLVGEDDIPASFEEQHVTLSLGLKIEFDLIIVGDWRGNEDNIVFEIVHFEPGRVEEQVLFRTNFSNVAGATQAYPDEIGGNNPRHTGAAVSELNDGIRWRAFGANSEVNAAYHFEFTVDEFGDRGQIFFRVNGLPETKWCAVDPMAVDQIRTEPRFNAETQEWEPESTPGTYPIFKGGPFTEAEFQAEFGYPAPGSLVTPPGTTPWEVQKFVTYPTPCWILSNVKFTAIIENRPPLVPIPGHLLQPVGIDGISLSPGLLGGEGYSGSLYFPNKLVDVEYVGEEEGRAVVRFEVGGYPGDVELFWDYVHERGLDQWYTLANYLDQRSSFKRLLDWSDHANPDARWDPTAANLPEKINPMLFVLRSILSYNLLIVTMKAGLEGDNALGMEMMEELRKALPAPMTYIVFTEIIVDDNLITTPLTEEVRLGAGPDFEETIGVSLTEQVAVDAIEGAVVG